MYNELVKDLLKKHFGEPRSSLALGDTGKPDGRLYYCYLKEEKEIKALSELLGMNSLVDGLDKLPELTQTLPDIQSGTDFSQCAYFREYNGEFSVSFAGITGVQYRRGRGNKVSANLTLGEPFVLLSDSATDFFGFFRKYKSRRKLPYNERDGFSYWINKALKTNPRFREFAADLFFAVAETEQLHILKDVSRTIRRCGCFLPPVSYQNLIECRTPKELLCGFKTEQTDLDVNLNKVDINVGYAMIKLCPDIDNVDRKVIMELDTNTISDTVSLNILYDGFRTEEFVCWYYRKKLAGRASDSDIRMFAGDYIRMCGEAGRKLRLSYSMPALVRAHNELAKEKLKPSEEELKEPLIANNSEFDRLDRSIKNAGFTEFERIVTVQRLFEEGRDQSNCVYSRRGEIRADMISVYHWKHKGIDYTVQFAIDRNKRYYLEEVRATYNEAITAEHFKDLKNMLKKINIDSNDDPDDEDDDDGEPIVPEYEAYDYFNENQLTMFDDDLPF